MKGGQKVKPVKNRIIYENDSVEISKRKITSRLYNVIIYQYECVRVCYVLSSGFQRVFKEIIRLCLKLSKLKRYLFRPVYLVLRINISILFFVLPEGNGKEKVSHDILQFTKGYFLCQHVSRSLKTFRGGNKQRQVDRININNGIYDH